MVSLASTISYLSAIFPKRNMLPSIKINCNSFIFLDIESTGIPFQEDDGGKTKITEISFVCVSRDVLSKVQDHLPRMLPKLTIYVNPSKIITDKISLITGLDNSMLQNEYTFDERKANTIKSFLDQCKPPLCLVAHNGLRFDFPLLKEELSKFKNIITEECRCADTLFAFRELSRLDDVNKSELTFNPFISETDIECVELVSTIEKQYAEKTEEDFTKHMELVRQLNETTPKSQKINSSSSSSSQQSLKRKLFIDEKDGTNSTNKVKFNLPEVYYRLFGKKPKHCHRAEDDTITLIKCCLKFGPSILKWFDENSIVYSDIKPTYSAKISS